jgi:uncharacterized protein (TIGR00369 family)
MNTNRGAPSGREVANYTGITMREVDDLRLVGHAPLAPHLTGPGGGIRTGALLTMIDNLGGLNGGLAALPDGWVVSTNLAARVVLLAHAGPLRIDSRILRRGRNSVVAEVQIRDDGAGDALVAAGVLTSAILVPENGPPVWNRPVVIGGDTGTAAPRPPIVEWIGARSVDAATIEMDLADELRNPWGILHGGVVATLVDLAAEHATGGGWTTDVVLHYLAPNRTGPVRAIARVLGRRADGDVVRIEIRDEGAARITAVAIATCTPPIS